MGNRVTCFVLDDAERTARCYGFNEAGQVGNGTVAAGFVDELQPLCRAGAGPTCEPLTGIISIDAGFRYACALRNGEDPGDAPGEVWCWGSNAFGQLGNGDLSVTERPVAGPVCVAGSGPTCTRLTGAVALATGQDFGCALLEDGTVKCWGDRGAGSATNRRVNPLGDGLGRQPTPRALAGDVCQSGTLEPQGNCVPLGTESPDTDADPARGAIVALTAGQSTACALSRKGAVLCWGGSNSMTVGTLGHSDVFGESTRPVPVCLAGDGDGFECPLGPLLSAAVRSCTPLRLTEP
jgi:alpha-tubulin suppressor-like RCC1 family protein